METNAASDPFIDIREKLHEFGLRLEKLEHEHWELKSKLYELQQPEAK